MAIEYGLIAAKNRGCTARKLEGLSPLIIADNVHDPWFA
jgi:hypothetical protein